MEAFKSDQEIGQEKAAIDAQRQAVLKRAKREYEQKQRAEESARKRKERTGEVGRHEMHGCAVCPIAQRCRSML